MKASWKHGRTKGYSGYLQTLSKKLQPPLESIGLVFCPVHVVMMKCSPKYCIWITEKVHTVVGFVPVRASNYLKVSCLVYERRLFGFWFIGRAGVHAGGTWLFSSQVNIRQSDISSIKDVMMHIWGLGEILAAQNFGVDLVGKDGWTSFLIVVSYCCHISEWKSM